MPKGIKNDVYWWGYKDHIIRVKRRAIAGAIKNGLIFACRGFTCSFANNFSASANGCRRPIIPTLLGPLRSCI